MLSSPNSGCHCGSGDHHLLQRLPNWPCLWTIVKGQPEKFRWWAGPLQRNVWDATTIAGGAKQMRGITGTLKGEYFPKLNRFNLQLKSYLSFIPMQPLCWWMKHQITLRFVGKIERGKSKATSPDRHVVLERQSWVVGLQLEQRKAYDWTNSRNAHYQRQDRRDALALALSTDNQSFVAFERSSVRKYLRLEMIRY